MRTLGGKAGGALVAAAAAASVLTLSGVKEAPASAALRSVAHPVNSAVTMVSDAGEYLGSGQSRIWTTPSDDITVTGSTAYVDVTVAGTSGEYHLIFSGPGGTALHDGTYENATATPLTTGVPTLEIFGEGRGCDGVGQFTVHDLAADLSRVWIGYEFHCESGRPAVFGEVRLGVPPESPGPVAAPSQVDWPTDYPGVSLKPVPVHLINTSAKDVRFYTPQITVGATDFSVLENDCIQPVPPGESCTVYVGFTPSRAGRSLGELAMTTDKGIRWVPLSGGGTSGLTSWDLHSPAGEPVGKGQDYHFKPATGTTISGAGNDTEVESGVWSGTHMFYAVFQAAPGTSLLSGTTFSDVSRWPNADSASMSVTGDSTGCNNLTGSFTVQHVSYDGHDRLTSLLLDFTQYCDNSTQPLTGTISWRMPDPSAPPADTTAPPPTTFLYAYRAHSGHTSVSWADPGGTPDWVDTVVRYRHGKRAPKTLDAGTPLYVGRDHEVFTTLPLALDGYSFTTFTRDTSGNLARDTLYLPPTQRLTVRARPLLIIKGHRTNLTGRLTLDGSQVPLGHHPMHLRIHHPGTPGWHDSRKFRTRQDGTYSIRIRLWRTTRFIVEDSFKNAPRVSAETPPVRVVRP